MRKTTEDDQYVFFFKLEIWKAFYNDHAGLIHTLVGDKHKCMKLPVLKDKGSTSFFTTSNFTSGLLLITEVQT